MKHVTLSEKQLREFLDLHPTLLKVVWTVLNLWPDQSMVVTSIARTWKHDKELGGSGVHAAGPPWRAIDISIRTLTEGQDGANAIAKLINQMWQYDPKRPDLPVAYAKPHGTGPHLHLQVHPNTERRE